MVANDQMAVGLCSALAVKVAVPGDVAVTGFDDIQLSRFSSPPLTTVHQPMRDLGARSVSFLLDRIAGTTRRAANGLAPDDPGRQGKLRLPFGGPRERHMMSQEATRLFGATWLACS